MKFKTFIFYWLPVLLYSGLIFYLSSLSKPIPDVLLVEFSYSDKLLHIIEYFILAFLVFRLLNFYKVSKAYLYAIILTVLYGITDEIHQLFVPGRFFSVYDIMANSIGALLVFANKYFYKKN
ncbi:MAG: VanZ family protein [Nanoarchaeota archaeon]|nr:VanZ family protein [Nanoarchaeota archaeon]MBU4242473.1 VanZ family protein [Nanoarchaeota archaeon]MBU4352004.1 VanZ family protein [Nanoarchaeota archaeon]MBU4456807.1 VanZ family protein [Nanoarchaeota archaeon]MCG2719389.1 VanZ family protein [Nanoarchaeota archaeon]